ncbi:unnamed protein product [Effrenium voratum]|nr:unnamed protein product [Effrenium voratum]CAJ1449381.1 unnamed protein product [Effrenium voratum]
MSREKAALVTAIDKCLDQKDATCGVVSKCYAAAARHGALGITELQEVLGLTSHGLGLPAWLFAGAEKVCERRTDSVTMRFF